MGAEFEVGGTVYVDGRDLEASPPLTVGRVNLWDGVPRRRVVSRVRHAARVRIVGRTFLESEGRWYYCVRRWGKKGWVPEAFLSGQRQDAVGDVV